MTGPGQSWKEAVGGRLGGSGLRLVLGLMTVGAHLRAELPASPQPPAAVTWDGFIGPWGRLRYSRVRLRTPAPTLAALAFPEARSWFFAGRDRASVDQFLAAGPLPREVVDRLRDPALRGSSEGGEGVELRIPDALRADLSAEARAYLYRELARGPRNPAQAFPFRVPPDDVLDRAALNPELRAAISRWAYPSGQRWLISDTDLLLPLVRDAAELLQLKRALCTFDTLSIELLRPVPADAAAMVAYWSPAGSPRAADVLQWFELTPDLASIDLAHLLPPWPEALLNRFADGVTIPGNANCFWASINFFRGQTNDAVLPVDDRSDVSLAATLTELDENYLPVNPPYRFGDVICLTTVRPDGEETLVHMVVLVAEGVVLTKNGAGGMSPFMLAPLTEVIDHYSWPEVVNLHAFRPRRGSPALPTWR